MWRIVGYSRVVLYVCGHPQASVVVGIIGRVEWVCGWKRHSLCVARLGGLGGLQWGKCLLGGEWEIDTISLDWRLRSLTMSVGESIK